MTSILLRGVNHFRYLPKIITFNENKKLINFAIQYYAKPIVLMRTTSQSSNMYKFAINEKINSINKCMLTHKWVKKEELEDVINLIQAPYYINNDQVLSLLQWCNNVIDCSPLEKVKLMEFARLTLTVCNFHLIVSQYNAILTVYLENNYDFSPNDLIMEMTNQDTYPDHYTYYLCIKYYCTKGNINEALLLWKYYFSIFPIYSVETVFNSLLECYSQLGNINYVNKIVNIMRNNNTKPSTESYTSIMCAHAKLNDIDKVKNILQTCHFNNIYFTNADILKVIYTLAVNNHTEHIKIMYQYLKKVLHSSSKEIQFILDLINIDQVDVALNAFLHTTLNSNKHSRYENIRMILKHVVDKSMEPDKLIQICNLFKNNTEAYKKSLLLSLYYSLLKDDKLSLSLLRICRLHCTIKPHYFWPILNRKAIKYDLLGILNVLEIMVNEFNTSPCVYTIADYVLPTCFGSSYYIKQLLLKYKVSETVINNALVLFYLKKMKVMAAALYVQAYPGKYFYKILAHDLRNASVVKNDVENFLGISNKLLEDTENTKHSTELHNNTYKLEPVSMDKQLYDTMIDCPSSKLWFKSVIDRLASKNIKLKSETISMINNFLYQRATDDVTRTLVNVPNKTLNIQMN